MKVEYKKIKDSLYLYFNGDLDHCLAEKIRGGLDKLISETKCSRVIFDFSDLNFMDSTGIGLIIGRYKLLKERNVQVYIANPSESVDKILKLSGVYNIISQLCPVR